MKIETIEDAIASLRFAIPILETTDFSSLDTLKAPFIGAISEA